MSIDTGQALTYNQNYPVPNVDQSSKQFRDNFTIIKSAVESLQLAHSDNSSVMAVTTSQTGVGGITINTSYKNNALVLPTGDPTSSAGAGMIRYDAAGGTIQFHNGSGWRPVVFKDAAGLVTLTTLTVTTKLTLNYTPTAATDAVPKSYVDSLSGGSNASVAAVAAGLAQEIIDRQDGDQNLQYQVDNANETANNAILGLDAVANTVGQFAVLIDNATILANTALDMANTAYTIANSTADGLAQEILDRIQGDLDNANAISALDGAWDTANAAFDTANAAFDAANSVDVSGLVSKTGDTMSGNLTISSGGINVGGTATFTGGNMTVGGDITATGDITAFSDMALKYNIKTIDDALALVNRMRGATFLRADLPGNPEQVGVIAQEMQEVMPQVVHEHENGLLSVAYGNLVGVLIEAVKQLSVEVNDLKSRLP